MEEFISYVRGIKTKNDLLKDIEKCDMDVLYNKQYKLNAKLAENERPNWRQLMESPFEVNKIDRLYDRCVQYNIYTNTSYDINYYLLIRQKCGDQDHIIMEMKWMGRVINNCSSNIFASWTGEFFATKDNITNQIQRPIGSWYGDNHRLTDMELIKVMNSDSCHILPKLTSLCRSFIYEHFDIFQETMDRLKLHDIADTKFFKIIDKYTVYKQNNYIYLKRPLIVKKKTCTILNSL